MEYVEGILNRAGSVLSELSGSNYSLNFYADCADIDDMDTYETGRFGRDKEVTKYCFHSISEAYKEMAKDIKNALRWSFDEKVVEFAHYIAENITKEYQKLLKNELREKADRMMQNMN